mgnify:FL=1
MRIIDFADGDGVPAIGQGTWMMAEGHQPRDEEIKALRVGFDLGLTLVDLSLIHI